jgi:hypothetical protein
MEMDLIQHATQPAQALLRLFKSNSADQAVNLIA